MFICSQSCDYHLLKQNPSHWWTHDFDPFSHSKTSIVAGSLCLNLVRGCHLCPSGFSDTEGGLRVFPTMSAALFTGKHRRNASVPVFVL